jgi:hypothetical protein
VCSTFRRGLIFDPIPPTSTQRLKQRNRICESGRLRLHACQRSLQVGLHSMTLGFT